MTRDYRIFQIIAGSLLILSSLITTVSLIPGVDWALYHRESSIGPLDYNLSADFDAVGFEYSLETMPSEDGGGFIGGVGGGIASNSERGEDWKAYPRVDRSVLENLGVIYDSYKVKSFQYELLMRDIPQDRNISYGGTGSPSVKLNVTLSTDLVPFWPTRGTRELDVVVSFTEADLLGQVTSEERENLRIELKRITILAKVDYDPETGEYGSEPEKIEEIEISEEFTEIGDSYTRSIEVEYPDGEDVVGFTVEIEASLTDYWGRQERSPLSGKANPINIHPVDTITIIRGAGIGLAQIPLALSILFSVTAAILILVTRKNLPGLAIPPAVFSVIGVIWYWTGMRAAVDLLGERLSGAEEGLSWGPGIFIASSAVLFLLISVGLVITAMILQRREGTGTPRFTKVSGAGPDSVEGTTESEVQFRRLIEDSQAGNSDQGPPPPPPVDPFSRP